MDYANKIVRQPLVDLTGQLQQLYNANSTGINPLMQQGFDAAGGLQQSMNPYLQTGNQYLQGGLDAFGGAFGGARALMDFNPYAYNAQYQAGQAYGPQYAQGVYQQAMSNAQGAIAPMLAQIGQMNARMFNRQMLPGIAASAIDAGAPTTKWGLNNALAAGEVANANANAAANLYGNAYNAAANLGGQYGLNASDQYNRMAQLNTQLQNQLQFQQAGQNLTGALSGMNYGSQILQHLAGLGGDQLGMMMDMTARLPGLQIGYGQLQQNAPWDVASKYFGLLSGIGGVGAPTTSTPGAGGSNAAAGAQAGLALADLLFSNWGKKKE
jgi:hypothetical protein